MDVHVLVEVDWVGSRVGRFMVVGVDVHLVRCLLREQTVSCLCLLAA